MMTAFLSQLVKPSLTNEPPSDRDLWRTDVAVVVLFVFALFLGIGIRSNVVENHRTVRLGEGLPSISVPAGWITGEAEGALLTARNPRSPGFFNSELTVSARPLSNEATLATVRTALGMQRTQDLLRYRELSADSVTVNNQPGVLVTYAYVADPTREQGAVAPPVVVEAQDLLFVVGDTVLVVTTAANTAHWVTESVNFETIHRSLNVRGGR